MDSGQHQSKKKALHVREARKILDKLLGEFDIYFDKNLTLNTEGFKLLSRLIRLLVALYPELKPLVDKVRKNPDYESISRLAVKVEELLSKS